jgi:hypothetical protein
VPLFAGDPCAIGKFSARKGADLCRDCDRGRFQGSIGQSLCENCKPGRSQPLEGQSSCVVRRLSWCFLALTVIFALQPCETGKSAELFAQPTCTPCGLRTASFRNGTVRCLECADSLICSGGLVTVPAGQWAYLVNNTLKSESCPVTACKGAEQFEPGVSAQCGDNRLQSPDNIMCGACEPDYTEFRGACKCALFALHRCLLSLPLLQMARAPVA